LDGKLDQRTIYNRKRKLMSLQRRISKTTNRELIGRELPVLVEGPSAETELLWQGRLSTQAPEIDGICYINDFGETEPKVGEMRRIRITESHDYDLVGELVDAGEQSLVSSTTSFFPILESNPALHASIPQSHPAARISSDPRA
jgi:ribosomal protein S12 methylthiotransferase